MLEKEPVNVAHEGNNHKGRYLAERFTRADGVDTKAVTEKQGLSTI